MSPDGPQETTTPLARGAPSTTELKQRERATNKCTDKTHVAGLWHSDLHPHDAPSGHKRAFSLTLDLIGGRVPVRKMPANGASSKWQQSWRARVSTDHRTARASR